MPGALAPGSNCGGTTLVHAWMHAAQVSVVRLTCPDPVPGPAAALGASMSTCQRLYATRPMNLHGCRALVRPARGASCCQIRSGWAALFGVGGLPAPLHLLLGAWPGSTGSMPKHSLHTPPVSGDRLSSRRTAPTHRIQVCTGISMYLPALSFLPSYRSRGAEARLRPNERQPPLASR